jgi:hypothetical protein
VGFRINNATFKYPKHAIYGIMSRLMDSEDTVAIIRVPDEDAAIALRDALDEFLDRIKIELDSTEKGPNPIWTPNGLTSGYDQVVHADGIEKP